MEPLCELENSGEGFLSDDDKQWDTKMEADIESNKLEALAKKALKDFADGTFKSI